MTIYSCVTGSRYTMSAQVYSEEVSQDTNTGDMVREYTLSETISCYASGIAASGKDVPGTFEQYTTQGLYLASDLIRLYSRAPVSKSSLVARVKDSNGVMWTEDDGTPTIFDSNGSTPIVGANGAIVEYVTMLTRSEVQDASIL